MSRPGIERAELPCGLTAIYVLRRPARPPEPVERPLADDAPPWEQPALPADLDCPF